MTRSFGAAVANVDSMGEAVAAFATRAAEKLRRNGLVASHANVFMHTSQFGPGPRRSAATTVDFGEATNDTLLIAAAARKAAVGLWEDGFRYAKAGVVMDDLVPEADAQEPLERRRDRERSKRLMRALDALNARHGRDTVIPASAGIRREWRTRAERRSPRYTTCLEELPEAATGWPASALAPPAGPAEGGAPGPVDREPARVVPVQAGDPVPFPVLRPMAMPGTARHA